MKQGRKGKLNDTPLAVREKDKQASRGGKRRARTERRRRSESEELREKRFPESNHVIAQFLLLLAGLVPTVLSGVKARVVRLRRKGFSAKGKRVAKWQLRLPKLPRKYHPLIFAALAVVIVTTAFLVTNFTFATRVFYEGEPVAAVSSRRAAKRTVQLTEALTGETTGEPFSFEDGALRYSWLILPRSELASREELQRGLCDALGLVSYGFSLIVDGETIGSTVYRGALESLLEQVKVLYASPDTLTIDFLEDVRIAEGYVPSSTIMNLGQIAEKVNATKAGEVTYTVQKGDTWGKIAGENDMTNAELEALNPGYNINRISIGDVLTISHAVPYLTVRVTERQNYQRDVQYEIEYEDDASMYKGDERVVSRGVYGKADVVADVVYINGVEQSREEISSVTLSEPVTEHRMRGTKPRPSWMASGSFRWPTWGPITSYFGYRSTGIRGASRFHKGIDIGVPYGTPIYASDGGTVSFSGYKGAMGYTVIIDHGNGFVTYYEHNSKLLVRAGEHVYKGQVIAKAGSTGVSSGCHCHFGIKRNGSFVNPLNYLP